MTPRAVTQGILKILGALPSINVRKVTWACDELGLLYEREDWGAGLRDPTSPDFVALNPMAHVPVLVDGDFVLWESNAIVRYLANAYGGEALLPKDPRARADVEKWMDWQATDLNWSWRPAFHVLVRQQPGHTQEAVDASVRGWSKNIAIIDARLAETGAFIAGPQFTLADIPIGLAIHRWLYTPLTRPDYPAVAAYYARLQQRPAFAASARADVP